MNNFKKNDRSSIYQCILPIYYFSKVFGLVSFNLPSKNEISKTYFNYFIVIICEFFYFYSFYYNVFRLPFMYLTESNILNACVSTAGISLVLIAIISLFISLFMGPKILQILKLVNECDDKVYKNKY